MRRRKRVAPNNLLEPTEDSQPLLPEPLLKRLVLRVMVTLGGSKHFLSSEYYEDEGLAIFLGLPTQDAGIDEEDPYSRPEAQGRLRRLLVESEEEPVAWAVLPALQENSDRLATLMGLDTLEQRLLEFAVVLHNHRFLGDACDYMSGLTNQRLMHVLSVLLDAPSMEVRAALAPKGRLASSGLLTVDINSNCALIGKLDLLSEQFSEQMITELEEPTTLLRGMVLPSGKPTLALTDYPHLAESLDILQPYLRAVITQRRPGVNILIHGPAGTGKSQLTRVMAQALEQSLFEVTSEDDNGDSVIGERRLRSYRLAQNFLRGRDALLLFDEIEDVFNDGNELWGKKSTAQSRKAWMNRMLEENPVPAFWLTNTVHGLDRAFLRRFDMVLEVAAPPRMQRERIVRQHSDGLLDEASVKRLADAEGLTPAVITRAAGVIQMVRDQLPPERLPAAMTRLVSSTLEAQGWGPLRDNGQDARPDFYDPRFVNTGIDLHQLAARLEVHPRGSLCFFGPSGTGKTAFGRWLADRLHRPLLVRRASDLLGSYVGETERNMARAFRDATESGAVLLIDEVDSFLQDRRRAARSWEVTQVNEMLTQMESFRGLFIASTNLMEELDPATMRRFDVKLRFDYLRSEQAREMLTCQCRELGLPEPGESELDRVSRLRVLTPGDFAVVRRQASLCGLTTPADLARVLVEECGLKEDGRKQSIGFV